MKALLIVNPVSGKRRIIGELVEIISRLEKGGYVTTVHVTERRGYRNRKDTRRRI